ncbi:MAG: hypothetical protein ACXADY_21890 [Candidatus Hodarchaeales archaeon]|jgi:hypothetical protein
MIEIKYIYELPETGAIYAFYGREEETRKEKYVAYIGQSGRLKTRIKQHLISRDSSVVTQNYAYALLPDKISDFYWWEYKSFNEEYVRQAAELVANDVFASILRTRVTIKKEAKELYEKDTSFVNEMKHLFEGDPTGHLPILRYSDVVEKVYNLEERILALEDALKEEKR